MQYITQNFSDNEFKYVIAASKVNLADFVIIHQFEYHMDKICILVCQEIFSVLLFSYHNYQYHLMF